MEGNDVTIDVLGDNRRTVLLLFPAPDKVGVVNSFALNELNDAALVAEANVVGLTPASQEQIEAWQDLSMASYPFYHMDDSELKMVARGNPAVVYLEDGIIKWKRTLSSLDNVDQAAALADIGNDYDSDQIMSRLMIVYLAAMLALLLLNRSHVVIPSLIKRRNKKPDNSEN
jgi:hypothetical protein